MKKGEKMAVGKKRLFMSYILNQLTYLENEVQELTSRIRYRKIDAVDCLELIIAVERLNSFREFSKSAIELLKLENPDISDLGI